MQRREDDEALVIRTDFGDEAAWRAVVEEVRRPWGDEGEFPPYVVVLERPEWEGARADEVFARAAEDEELSVVFLADRHTMESPVRALLALNLGWEDPAGLDPVYDQELIEAPEPRELRLVPGAVHVVHANLQVANMDFAEFAEAAEEEPDGVLRGL
ncbi:DUF6924 domain-containing protein [Streptomyces sp. NPDC087440]|uniref:DUF6924 domain-containing protein n=1 Tax=Streptomyces sp. NPDC087440 TaxID=3365790 RepID=UPI003829501F